MAAGTKFQDFVEQLGKGNHKLHSDQYYVALTNTQPNAATAARLADITQIASGTGYAPGGAVASLGTYSESGGTLSVTLTDPATWTGSGAGMGPFQWAVLYNYTSDDKWLVAYWAYGASPTTLLAGEELTVDLAGPIIQIT